MDPTLENATVYWDALAERVETFLAAWETLRQPPPLAEHLPEGPTVLRHLTLVELIKVDLELRWTQGFPKTIEEYLAEFPELATDCGPPADLVYEEYHVRRSEGETVSASEYFRRFPKQEDQLRRLMGLGDPMASTALYPRGCVRDFEPGETIDDFLILARLGKGSFASVYLAQQKSMHRRVALKVSPHKGQEAQTLAQLDHNNIVRVYDQRVLPEGNVCLLYMQYVAGGTLADVIERIRHVPLPQRTGTLLLRALDEVLRKRGESPAAGSVHQNKLEMAAWPVVVCHIGEQLAYALNYAQAQGVLHRDIKPANVLMSADGAPMLADFNISFSSQLDGAAPAAYFGGSLAYMSPEQLEACNPAHPRSPEELDGRSDIYSLGVLLWELLYGKRPWPNEQMEGDWAATLSSFARRRREEFPEPPEPLGRDPVLRELHAVLEKCLAPAPNDRFANGGELGKQLWLCTRPHTQMLLKSPHQGLGSLARRHPILTFMVAILLPHLLAACFNYFYNWTVIIREVARTNPDAVQRFEVVANTINVVFFTSGLVVLLWLVWPVYRALVKTGQAGPWLYRFVSRRKESHADADSFTGAQPDANPLRATAGSSNRVPSDSDTAAKPGVGKVIEAPITSDELKLARKRSLRLPFYAAAVGISLWLLASALYPLMLPLSWSHGVHFFLSLVVCGLIVGVYPFFGAASVGVRVLYPALLTAAPAEPHEESQLRRLVSETGVMLLTAVAVPLMGGFMLYVGQKFGLQNFLVDVSLGLLFLVGLFGVFVAFFVHQRIREDVEALIEAAQPTDTHIARSTVITKTAGG